MPALRAPAARNQEFEIQERGQIRLRRAPVTRTKTVRAATMVEYVQALHNAKRSLRRIAREDFGDQVSYGVIARLMQGIEPRRASIRAALGLPPLLRLSPGAGIEIAEGAVVLRSSRRCACGCERAFIPNSWNHRYLPGHRRHRSRGSNP